MLFSLPWILLLPTHPTAFMLQPHDFLLQMHALSQICMFACAHSSFLISFLLLKKVKSYFCGILSTLRPCIRLPLDSQGTLLIILALHTLSCPFSSVFTWHVFPAHSTSMKKEGRAIPAVPQCQYLAYHLCYFCQVWPCWKALCCNEWLKQTIVMCLGSQYL